MNIMLLDLFPKVSYFYIDLYLFLAIYTLSLLLKPRIHYRKVVVFFFLTLTISLSNSHFST